jgi:methyl-accepting chemotaxis protein
MLKNIKIGKKIIFTVILTEILFCIVSVVGIVVTDDINATYSYTLTNYGFSENDIGLFNSEFNSCRATMRDMILETNAQKIQAGSDQFDKLTVKANTHFTNMKKTMLPKVELGYYNDIQSNLAKYKTVCDQVIALAKQNKKAEAYTLLSEQAEPISDKIRTSTDALISEKTTTGHQLVADLSSKGEFANNLLISVFLSVIVLSLVAAIKISRGISKPATEMLKAANRMAEGDLSAQVKMDSKDEIGQLGKAFAKSTQTIKAYITDIKLNLAKMAQGDLSIALKEDFKGDFEELKYSIDGIVASFNDALMQINQVSQQVSNGSEQVSNGAQALAQGATEQASSIEELSASINEISSHIKNNAEHAVNASTYVNQVSSEIEISNKHMNDMVTAISQINDSSSEIGKIIKTIEDIAFQTNILALNAAVEAARAGAAGKGFAVVADEVRNLASKSAEAAKNTTSLIENSMRQVESGTKIADETAKSLLKVVESAKAVSETVEKISEASNQQSDAIGQIIVGVEQISSVVQTNSATAEESAAESKGLYEQAQVMKELVERFKLRNKADQGQNVESQPRESQYEEIYSDNSKY